MTAKSLINPLAVRNLGCAVKENKKLMIVISILHLLGIPMGSVVILVQFWLDSLQQDGYYYSGYVDLSGYMVIACGCLGAALLIGMIAATGVFQELWKKTRVDMIYSLPMTGSQRFASHYLAGTVVYVLPYLIACVLGWLILITGGFVLDFEAMDTTRSFYFEILFKYYTIGTIGAFLLMMLYYTTTVLFTVCCGTLFESIYTTLLLNCLVPGTFAAVLAVICDNVTGLSFEYLWHPIGYTSPAGGLIYLLYLTSGGDLYSYSYHDLTASQATTHGMIPAFIRWSLVMVVLIAAVLVLAWHLYRKRRAEAVGKPYVYLLAYYIMLTLLTVLILTLFAVGMNGAAILFAAVVYLIMEVVRKRGFRKFWLSAVSFACTVAITIGLFALVNATKAFGSVYRIPAAAAVTSVRLEFTDMPAATVDLEYTDKEIIRQVQELHRDIVTDMKEYDDIRTPIDQLMEEMDYRLLRYDNYDYYGEYDVNQAGAYGYSELDPETMSDDMKMMYYDYWYETDLIYADTPRFEEYYQYAETEWLDITYYTVTGSTVHRSFNINMDQYCELLNIVYGTELYAQMYADYLYNNLGNTLSEYNEDGTRKLNPAGEMTLENLEASRTIHFLCTEELLERLRDAYYSDLLELDPAATGGVYAMWRECPIWNNCTATIAILEEEMGMEPFDAVEIIGIADLDNNEHEFYTNGSYMEVIQDTLDIRIYTPETVRFASKSGVGIAGHQPYVKSHAAAYTDRYHSPGSTAMREVYPELYKLLNAAVRHEITENSYMIVVNGTWWTVPQEYAEAVIAKGSGYAEEQYWDQLTEDYEWQYRSGEDEYYDDIIIEDSAVFAAQ